jgi:regulator of replication initiation timing
MKDKIIIGLAIALVAALSSVGFIGVKYQKAKEKSETLENTVTDMNQEIKKRIVSLNDSVKAYVSEVNALNMTIDNLNARYGETLKKLSVKPKDVDHYIEVKSEIRDTVKVPVYYDSFDGIETGYKDDFTDINVKIGTDKQAEIDYKLNTSLSVINTQKRHSLLFGLIKWKETEKTLILSKNPKENIENIEYINVIE